MFGGEFRWIEQVNWKSNGIGRDNVGLWRPAGGIPMLEAAFLSVPQRLD